MPNELLEGAKKRILQLSLKYPAYGQQRKEDQLSLAWNDADMILNNLQIFIRQTSFRRIKRNLAIHVLKH